MARKYSERIEDMDDAAREEFDTRIREYEEKHGWQAALAKFKPSPIQLRAIKAGKDARKAKAKPKRKQKNPPKKAAKKASKKKSAKKKAAKKKPGRPKGSGKKKAAKKASRKNGVVKTNAKGDLIIEGVMSASDFVEMVFAHSERLMKAARA